MCRQHVENKLSVFELEKIAWTRSGQQKYSLMLGPVVSPIAASSVCLHIVLVKLNFTDDEELSLSSINSAWGMGGAEEGSLDKAFAHMPIVSLRDTLVNRLQSAGFKGAQLDIFSV